MSKPILHGKKWRIRWIDATGIRRGETYLKRDDAKFALARHHVEVEEVKRGLRGLHIPNKTFADLCDYWLRYRTPQKRRQRDDVNVIKVHLRPAFGHVRLSHLSVQHVDQFSLEREHLSKKTLHNHLTLFISMLNQAQALGWLSKVPRIQKPKVQLFSQEFRYFKTADEIQRFLQAAKDESDKAFFLYATAIYSGLRQGELAGLLWNNVDLEKRLITVERSYDAPTKSGKVRYVPILDVLLPLLKEWRAKAQSQYVFPNEFNGMLKPNVRLFQETLVRVLRRAGFPERVGKAGSVRGYLVFHDLRHVFASQWVICGGDIFKLQNILGHQSVQMTMRYAHLSPHVFRDDYGRFNTNQPLEVRPNPTQSY